ncbi:unnamed protein product [marine sediment metagenome]|uniref:Uncharacterized protein n=1 Tax=marine sediment metagenome TaxID=412755 RepID=X1A7V0_9ZZZZ
MKQKLAKSVKNLIKPCYEAIKKLAGKWQWLSKRNMWRRAEVK